MRAIVCPRPNKCGSILESLKYFLLVFDVCVFNNSFYVLYKPLIIDKIFETKGPLMGKVEYLIFSGEWIKQCFTLQNFLKCINDHQLTNERILHTVCSCHVTFTFQSVSTLSSCLNVKELLAQSRRGIWSLNDCNWTRIHNPLVYKRKLNHLTKLAKFLNGWVFVYELNGCGFESSFSQLNVYTISLLFMKIFSKAFNENTTN